MRLVLDVPENVANASRRHWSVLHRAKKAYYAAQDGRALVGLIPPPPSPPMASVRVLAHFRLWNEMDDDNLKARMKWPQDYLKTRGYIANDNPKVVRELVVTQEIDRKNQRLEITIEEVDGTSSAP